MPSFVLIAAKPLPIQLLNRAIFTSPTGALTDNNKSFFSAIFIGLEQEKIGIGYISPNSALPCKKGNPTPLLLYVEDGGDCPILTLTISSSPKYAIFHPRDNLLISIPKIIYKTVLFINHKKIQLIQFLKIFDFLRS